MKKRFYSLFSLLIAAVMVFSAGAVFAAADDGNIAAGKPYTITTEASIENAYPNLVIKDDGKMLTDGKKSDAKNYATDWLEFYRGLSHDIVIDLGEVTYVNKISVGFLNISAFGIYYPREVSFAVSVDGNSFSTVFTENDNDKLRSTVRERVECSYTADGSYAARYVRVHFVCDVNVYVDEIEVFAGSSDSVIETTPDAPVSYPDAFGSNTKPILDGAKDIVLVYNGEYYRNQIDPIGTQLEDKLRYLAAYIDKNGEYNDTLFDSFLFLPLAPGDDCIGSLNKQEGWEIYLENTIGAEDGANLTALNKVVGEIKTKLGLPDDYKVNIFMTVPYLLEGSASFGKLGGDVMVSPRQLEDACKIVKWYVDLSTEAFEAQSFEHLNLTGFYWYSELVRYSKVSYDEELIKYFTSYCHEKDHAAIWIPYYCAPGFNKGVELGFDAVSLQTGYAFTTNKEETGIPQKGNNYDAMSMAKKYGLGVEIELALGGDAHERYTDYLSQSYFLGNMQDGVSMFYQGGGNGDFYNSAVSASVNTRKIYDMTYQYVKDTFNISVPVLDYEGSPTVIIDLNNERNRGNLPVVDSSTISTSLRLAEFTRPEHGTLTLEGSGFFFYTPDAGYTGDDSFSFSVTNGFYTSELYTVSIKVVDRAIYCNNVNGKLLDNRAIVFKDTEKSQTGDFTAYEVAVNAEGVIVSAAESSGIDVPEGGFVISATGDKAEWLKNNVKVGERAEFDGITYNVAFYEALSGDVSAAETSSEASQSPSGGTQFPIIPVVAAVVAVLIIAIVVVIIIKSSKRRENR